MTTTTATPIAQFLALVNARRTHGVDMPRPLYFDAIRDLRALYHKAYTAKPFRADRVCDRVARVLELVQRGPRYDRDTCHALCAEQSSILQAEQSFAGVSS